MMTPKQRMLFDGAYLEDLVKGYHTLEVTGREPFDLDIDTIKLQTVNGERFLRKRVDARTIKVRFMIRRDTPEDFLKSYVALNGILTASEVQLIFDDEPDKYFIGTPQAIDVDYPGQSVSEGTITIKCSDPFKYSLAEFTEAPTVGLDGTNAEVIYEGTHPAYPIFDITMVSNLGFIGISDERGHTIQLGDPLDPDQEADLPDTESIVTITSEPPIDWNINDGFAVDVGTATKTVMGNVQEAAVQDLDKRWATPTYGTQASGWHGPTLAYTIPNGGAVNATFSWNMLYYDSTTNYSQLGMFVAEMQDAGGGDVAAIVVYHSSSGDANSKYEFWLNGVKVRSGSWKATKTNTVTGEAGGYCYMEKFGSTVSFKFGATVRSYTDEDLENVAVTDCGFYFARSGTAAAMARNRLSKATIIAHQTTTPDAVPNKFQAGDTVTVDTASGSIYHNGALSENLGALGNDFEGFTLTPGSNVISFVCSSWATDDPDYQIRYREAFI